ncbi:hypothetical protein ACC691_37495, partial [Rhizobium johnstonii]
GRIALVVRDDREVHLDDLGTERLEVAARGLPQGDATMDARGFVPAEFADREIWDLSIWSWNDFLDANGDPALHALADVEADKIFPQPTGALPDQYGELCRHESARVHGR